MMRTTLKVIGGTVLLVLLGAGLWWHLNGPSVLYGQFSPSTEQRIGDQEVPHTLPAAQWQADLDSLSAILHRRLIYLDDAYGAPRLANRVDSLQRIMPERTRDQRILSVAHLLDPPAPGTGHIGMSFVQRPVNWSLLPVRIFRFDDGYYVVDAMAGELIGHKVLSIGGTPVDSVAAALAPWGLTTFAEPYRAVGGSIRSTRLRSGCGPRTVNK